MEKRKKIRENARRREKGIALYVMQERSRREKIEARREKKK